MCRLFALRANQPSRVLGSLVSAPHSLLRQSCGDRRGECHEDGWGIGHCRDGQPFERVRSVLPPSEDPQFRTLAADLAATTLLAHIRQASTGSVAERNCHPFLHGRWLFAHNGTLEGFAAAPGRLLDLIPPELRRHIRGETDSEHIFFYLLSRLQEAAGSADGPADAATVGRILGEVVVRLAELFPGGGDSPTRLNFVLTDGRILAASRWGHSLYRVERRGLSGPDGDGPVAASPDFHAVAVASEPTSPDEDWAEIPDRSVLAVGGDLGWNLSPL